VRHDYILPPEWDDMTDEERSRWMTQERCRRQAMRQDTAYGRYLRNRHERMRRRFKANGYEDLAEKR
jgi:hypothetical protein